MSSRPALSAFEVPDLPGLHSGTLSPQIKINFALSSSACLIKQTSSYCGQMKMKVIMATSQSSVALLHRIVLLVLLPHHCSYILNVNSNSGGGRALGILVPMQDFLF